jgi:hypothetical protein
MMKVEVGAGLGASGGWRMGPPPTSQEVEMEELELDCYDAAHARVPPRLRAALDAVLVAADPTDASAPPVMGVPRALLRELADAYDGVDTADTADGR